MFMGALPLFHSFGMTCVLNTGVHESAVTVQVPNPRDLPSVLKAAHKHRPTIFSGRADNLTPRSIIFPA